MSAVAENADPNLSLASGASLSPAKPAAAAAIGRPPRANKKGLRVSISPKAKQLSPRAGGRRRRSSSHFGGKKKRVPVDTDDEDDDGEESDIEFTLDGAADIGAGKETIGGAMTPTPKNAKGGKKGKDKQQRRRRRSSARFLLAGGDEEAASPKDDDLTSSEHLGEIYRQAIQLNAENKINAGNSWGLRLIENMDKFITEGDDNSPEGSPRDDGREQLKAARKMKSRDEKGRVNFTKASCTLDASVKIYSYRVDDVHLSSYRVLANLNRTDTKNDKEVEADGEEGGAGGEKTTKRRANKGPTETLESNLANINMSRLDSAYDIDPLFHKMSKSFDEGGAKGLLLGNLGVSHDGCRIVFDSKEDEAVAAEGEKLETVEEADEGEEDDEEKEETEEEFGITNEEATVWKESEIDITNLASKLSSMLQSYGHASSASVPFVPQLESLRQDYAKLEDEGYGVDEKDAAAGGRKRLRLYDAPEDEEKEAERSIHVIAMERSRGSVLGMSFDTNFRLSMGDLGDEDDDVGGGGGEFNAEDFGGEGEFAPDDGGFGEGEFAPDFGGGDGGFDANSESNPGTFVDARSYANTKVLLDALCDGDAFYDGATGGNSDYAFFDMKKLERATDGNLWAGSQHWKKKPALKKDDGKKGEKKRVMFDDGEGAPAEKKERKKAVKKDRVFVDFAEAPDIDSIFEKKKAAKKTKKSKKDAFQMPKTEKDFLLPPDAGVDISQLARLFSRPKAVVRRVDVDAQGPVGKTVGFHDIEDNVIGFDDNDDGDFGGGDGGFAFAYDDEDDDHAGAGGDADYNLEDFDDVRKVEKIDVKYATVAKKVDVRRLKKDLWSELEEKTAWILPEESAEDKEAAADEEEKEEDDIFEEEAAAKKLKGEPQFVSFKETVEKMETAQRQDDVTVSFYFICCLHLANEKGLKLDSTGLEDFVISLDDGSAPEFGTFGDGFSQTANKLKGAGLASSRGKRGRKGVANYDEGSDCEEAIDLED